VNASEALVTEQPSDYVAAAMPRGGKFNRQAYVATNDVHL